jgi:2,4-diaminopentanoate dehydrogenase
MTTTHRVVQWTTGNVARETVRAVLARPDLELVGAYAFSAEKVGKDVADLCGLDRPTGVVATDDVDELLGLRPDCVVYTPLHFDVPAVSRLLAAGVNVVTTSEFLTGGSLSADDRSALDEAAAAGGATLFGSGMNPGFAQLLAAVAAGISRDVRRVAMTESVDVSQFAGDANMEPLGWGRPPADPGHAAEVEAATAVFADGVDVLAALLGLSDGQVEPRCTVAFAAATEDLDLPGRRIAAGHVAGIDVRWEGLVAGRPVIELHQRWIMGRAIEPAWTVEHAYLVEVDGDPQVRLRLEIWPDQELATLTPDDVHAIGMRITGLPVVNAIPAVCAAPPGISTYADLPPVSAHLG